jgi:hypothetical protein
LFKFKCPFQIQKLPLLTVTALAKKQAGDLAVASALLSIRINPQSIMSRLFFKLQATNSKVHMAGYLLQILA